VDKDTAITFQAKNISIARALDLVTAELNGDKDRLSSIYWVVDRGIVQLSTGTALNQVMRTRVFDVADLLMVVPSFVGPRVSLEAIGQNGGNDPMAGRGGAGGLFKDDDESKDGDEPTMAELRAQQRETLLNAVKESIGQDMWVPEGQGSIKLINKQLIITQSLLGFKLMEETIGG
jgi:hypothetical protein